MTHRVPPVVGARPRPGEEPPGPLVVLTTDRRPRGPVRACGPTRRYRNRPPRAEVFLVEACVHAVRRHGGRPLLFPPGAATSPAELDALVELADGVVITGGPVDVHPSFWGGKARDDAAPRDDDRARAEIHLARACMARGVPLLGVCGGEQVMAIAAGGALYEHLPRDLPQAFLHEQPTDPVRPWHRVRVEHPRVRPWIGEDPVRVNSTHHQAVADPGELVVGGRSSDGVVEVVLAEDHPFCLGVQWHPELLDDQPYRALCRAAQVARIRSPR